ncbi:type II toxin-antitoxin system mRNA interferase toxin, RelE/StbE family [Levilactobacillus cerevisiae]|uniref:type II toxin-antitoxin system mRNA interferase toxin, RelE/StbE family n=1 Tax=Levilactobacillus cerevisiae TaxID=1704076 RepID=UPI000F7962A8|nr:type II toxin-antitoxin system mRNA interferase toxin, RelE/StbE family [Levilactobacillus cerevisiae]
MQVKATRVFMRNLKKLSKKHYDMAKLKYVISLIKNGDDKLLVRRFDRHILTGDKFGIYELHLERNWLLLYQIDGTDQLVLLLLDTGSHDILR